MHFNIIIIFRVTGDGNCLFNSCSISLIGDESLSIYLRCLTSIEMFKFSSYYANHPAIYGHSFNGKPVNENTIFSIAISQAAFQSYEKDDRLPSVIVESENNAKNYTYSSFLSLFALSSVIGRPIESYYPIESDAPANIYESIFNCTVSPRPSELLQESVSSHGREDSIHIFRCASVSLDYITTTKLPPNKDHFVSLMMPPEEDNTQLTIPMYLLRKRDLLTQSSSTTTPTPIITSATGMSSESVTKRPKKRKQLSIGSFTEKVTPTPKVAKKSAGDDLNESNISVPTPRSVLSSESIPADENHNIPQVCTPGSSGCVPQSHNTEDVDVGNLLGRVKSMSDEEKYKVLTNNCRPGPDFPYPMNSSRRKFQHKWFSEFNWLAYSKSLDGAFCLTCVLFGATESTHNATKINLLFTKPFTNWSNAVRGFRDHTTKSPIHQTSTLRATLFRQCIENKVKRIDLHLNKIADEQVRRNREKLAPIVGAVILCGRQNWALRGHRDDSQYYDDEHNNPGGVQEVLGYLNTYGENSVFQDHMANAPKTATYRSKTTQNEILAICEEMIKEKLSSDIKEAKYFSVLADEAADVSKIEQLSLVVRYVNTNAEICEVFTGFLACKEGVTGEAIAKKVKQGIEDISLDMSFCRGQGYDGAGNMAGKCSGAAARIRNDYPNAPYVHCGAHALNLSVAAACNIQVVRNMMGNVRVVSDFFNVSPKRFDLLTSKIKEIHPSASHTRLIDVCRTRWIARIDGLEIFVEVFKAIVESLRIIKDNVEGTWNSDSERDARGLFHGITQFHFMVCLVVVSRCLEVTRPLTKQLQSSTFDVVASNQKVTLLFVTLQRIRREISELHTKWYSEAENLASSIDVAPSKPRTAQRQVHRANMPSDTVSQYYERAVTLPFLDHLTSQLQTRFSDRHMSQLSGFYAFPSKVVSLPEWKEKFSSFLDVHADDLPELRYIDTELAMWEEHCMSIVGTPPETLSALLPTIDKLTFPNIYVAMQILATLPVTTCTCERSISVLRRLKTYLRSTMTEKRLNALALLHVHREINLDVQEVINRFAVRHPRRMKLLDILNTDP